MSPASRGIRNAFRNVVRTTSIVTILGLSIGLCLTMLVAQKAVDTKIQSVKSSVGNTIAISPAGFNPGSQANNALTTSDLNAVKKLSHVASLTMNLTDRLPTTGSDQPNFGFGRGGDNSGSTTSLTSPVEIKLGAGPAGDGPRIFINGGSRSLPTNFTPPVEFLGTSDPSHVNGTAVTIKNGKTISGSADTNDALISTDMASKNNLSVGSTFTAYDTTLTVAGVFSSDTRGEGGTVILSLPTLQRLSGQADVVTAATATVDSLDNLASVTSTVKTKLGSKADVQSAQDQADATVEPLNSVHTVATFSLIGAAAAGAVIILLTMIMVVRERKKEIGVLKAIGGSNVRIMGEFAMESLTLAVLGAVIGLLIGIVGGQPVTKMLVSNSASSSNTMQIQGSGGRSMTISGDRAGGPRFTRLGGDFRRSSVGQSLTNVNAQVGPSLLAQGFGVAVLIAIAGSSLAAVMISKVRPATVMRAE